MSDPEAQDPVVQEEVKQEVSPEAELTTPAEDSQVPEEIIDLPEERKTIPKERFDQVYARTKRAEAEAKELQAQLQREREERIRLEERSKVQTEQQTQKEMTWAELETGIAEGRWTRDQAQDYKDKMTEQRLERKFKEKQHLESKESRILGEIEQYKQLVPEVMVPGSESRTKYEREFQYLVRNGAPDNYVTQLAATRAAFGDPDTIKARKTAKTVLTPKEPFMETHTPSKQASAPSKSFKDTLSPVQVKHYEKLIEHGQYPGGWADVEKEHKYVPKFAGRR